MENLSIFNIDVKNSIFNLGVNVQNAVKKNLMLVAGENNADTLVTSCGSQKE